MNVNRSKRGLLFNQTEGEDFYGSESAGSPRTQRADFKGRFCDL